MINLINGDCLEVYKNLPQKSVDMVLCDPPYQKTNCKWDILIPLDKMWEMLNYLCKNNACIAIHASQPFTSLLVSSNLKMFKYNWVWAKNCPSNIANANYMPLRYTEDICIFYKQQPIFNKQMIARSESGKNAVKQKQSTGCTFKLSRSDVSSNTSVEIDPNRYDAQTKNPSNLIHFGVDRTKKYKHPSKKPLALVEYLINTYTNKNNIVLDFAMGSGTTGLACKKTERSFIGVEKDNLYFNMAKERIENEQQ